MPLRILSIKSLIESAELDVILFLIGMMIIVGVIKRIGLFTWIIQSVISIRRMNGFVFISVISILAALSSCVVDEVTSIVFICVLIFQVCNTLKVNPMPFLITAVITTNIGSSGTMLGNPVGILIGAKAGLSFEDFIIWAFPVMLICLLASLGILLLWYRKDILLLSQRMAERRKAGLELGPLIKIPYSRGLYILVSLIILIALHRRFEIFAGVEKNTFLLITPLLVAGILMVWRHNQARELIEQDVEWWTLVFFMMLFAISGTLEHTGVTSQIAKLFASWVGNNPQKLTPVIILFSALGSAFVDNVVFVAAFIPIAKELNLMPLWWALLFGACYGGNITIIGSTANMVAMGLLEKHYRKHIPFLEWLKIGAIIGLVTCLISWAALTVLAPYMPPMNNH